MGDELVLISENGDLKETLCTTKTVNACQFQAWSPYGNAVIFSLEEDAQKEWKFYSLETESFSNLADFGEGEIDWGMDVQFPEIEPTIAPTATLQKITETPVLQKEIQSTPTTPIEPEKMRSNIIILIISGICLFIMGLGIVVFLVIYLRKKRNYSGR